MDASSSKIGKDTTSVASSNQTISTNYKVMASENDPFDKAKTNPILVMAYPENIKLDKEKHEYEAKLALNILKDKRNRSCIMELCRALIKKTESLELEEAVFVDIGKRLIEDITKSSFPSHKSIQEVKSKKSFIDELIFASNNTYEDSAIHALSLIWNSIARINKSCNVSTADKIDGVHLDFKNKSRSHDIKVHEKLILIPNGCFGESEIKSVMLNNLHPLYKLSKYYIKNDEYIFKKFINGNDLYLSGTSGMCNSFYNIYSLLDIDFNSDHGIKLAEIMSAFVVGIGFHTFKEAYDAFNITYYALSE